MERAVVDGYAVERALRRKCKVLDNDLPAIADAYWAFRAECAESGLLQRQTVAAVLNRRFWSTQSVRLRAAPTR